MLPATATFWKTTPLALLVIWNTFLEWEIFVLDCFWHRTGYCFKKIARKNKAKQEKAILKNISNYFQFFFNVLIFS